MTRTKNKPRTKLYTPVKAVGQARKSRQGKGSRRVKKVDLGANAALLEAERRKVDKLLFVSKLNVLADHARELWLGLSHMHDTAVRRSM